MTRPLATHARMLFNFSLAAALLYTPNSATAQTVTTVAGGYIGDGGRAINAAFNFPPGIAQDQNGNYYVSDLGANRIRKIDGKTGNISTIAGTGAPGYNGDNIPASQAQLSSPAHLRFDPQGDLVVSDSGNCLVRKIDTQGIITNIAGTGQCGYSGAEGTATSMEIGNAYGIAYDPSGNLYICDWLNNVVWRVDTAGIIHIFAGSQNLNGGYGGNEVPATQAVFNFPIGVESDLSGNIYIADCFNNLVRKVDKSGVISNVAGNQTAGSSGEGVSATTGEVWHPRGLALNNNSLYISDGGDGRIRRVDLTANTIQTYAGVTSGYDGDGHALTVSEFYQPGQMIFNSVGQLVVADAGNGRIREAGNTMATIAGGYIGDGGAATEAAFLSPQALATDPVGNSYVVDQSDNRVRKINAVTGQISTVVGTGISGYSGDGGRATAAELWFPGGVAVDPVGNIFVSDSNNGVIRKVDALGNISTFSRDSRFSSLGHIALDPLDNLYVVDSGACVVWKINQLAQVTVFAGVVNQCGYNAVSRSMKATAAYLNQPYGLGFDGLGQLYIADSGNSLIRKVNLAGTITTIAGTQGAFGFSGDGGQATSATLNFPQDVLVGYQGIYIADSYNARIRKIAPSGIITTFVGTGIMGYNGNGLPADLTNIDVPVALAQNLLGTLFELDASELLLREIQ
jgi:trimeric autotransporter adhesin